MRMLFCIPLFFLAEVTFAQTTVFSSDFTTSAGTTYTAANGAIGNSTTWSFLRSGSDMGARINSGYLSLTNDATGIYNTSGWGFAYNTSAFASPATSTLANNPGMVTWTFNMRQARSNPSSLASGYYGNAFVLAGTANTTATTGSGYAVILGESGKTDRLRLVRYTAGLRTYTTLMQTNTSGLTDWGNQYMSVKVTYIPSGTLANTWQLYVRNDNGIFQDPSSGSLTSQGTVVNSQSTTTALPLIGAFWNAATKGNQTAYFDNIKVSIATPAIASLSPTSKVAGSANFPLVVNGSNFTSASVIRWNGNNLVTTYVSPTQLSGVVPALYVTTQGSAAISVVTGAAISNSQTFYIDPANTPSISTSTNALSNFTTITGTASASQSFTSTGSNLNGGNITITAPSIFEVSAAQNGGYNGVVTVGATTTTTYVRVKSNTPPGVYTTDLNLSLSTPGATSKQIAVTATVLSTEPTANATTLTFTGTTSISTNINWASATSGGGTNHLVVVREASAVSATVTDGVTYAASTVFGAGSEVGNAGFVVYKGTGNTVSVTGLNPNTAYYVAVYEYNGSAGTENYRTASALTGNTNTLIAPAGLQVTTPNTRYTVDFDTTVESVNNGVYAGGGSSATPDDGELNSKAFAFGPLTPVAATFETETAEDDPSYGNGSSSGGVTDGGFYAFEVAPDNFALGIQPLTGEYASGNTTFRFQNQTGAVVTSLSIGYKVYIYNDEAGSNSYNFSHSANNSTYTQVTALDNTSPAAADAAPGWKAYYKVVTLTGLSIANNAHYYLRWSGAPVSGTVYDEIALDDIVIVANPSTNFAPFSGTAETFVLAGNASITGDTTVNGTINFTGGKAILGSNTLTLNGAISNNTPTGSIIGGGTGSIVVNGSVSRALSFDQTTVGTTNALNNLTITTTGTAITSLSNSVAVNGTLTVDDGQKFNLGTSRLTGSLTTIVNNGTIITQNTTTTPFTDGKVWGGTGTVTFSAASAAQTLVAGTYNNLTISTTGGAIATGNVTVNGILYLQQANPSATLGALDTGTNTLTMGPVATNTGVGDVSGIISRTSISPNVEYTFGHPQTSIILPNVGTLPTFLSIKTVLGQAPANKPDAILRTYDFIQSGASYASPTKAIIKAHYLDSELNSNIENKLVDWVVQLLPTVQLFEQSRTNYSTSLNYVELANVNVGFFSSAFGSKKLTMANSQVTGSTWNGSQSSEWIHAPNWTPAAVPSSATNVIIPNAATTNFDPEVTSTTPAIGTISIEAGGVVSAPTGSVLTVAGATGAWINYGTLNAATGSTVTFTSDAATAGDATMAGSTTFNNITVPAGTTLRVLSDNTMNISGTFTKLGSFIAGSVQNTVIYSGINQTLVVPNGAQTAYHDLTITGTGAIFPASQNIKGDLTTNQAIDFTGKTISLVGTDELPQKIGGTTPPVLNNLIIDKPAGITGNVELTSNATVNGTLTLTSGLLKIKNFTLTLGTSPVAGTFSNTTMIIAEGIGYVRRPFTATGSYSFPIGETTSNTTYSPISVNITAATGFNNAYVGVSVRDAVHPNNYSTPATLTRYWNVRQSGISGAVATITGTYTTDAGGAESLLSAAQLNGTFNVVTNPWIKFGLLGGNTLTATNALLTSNQVSAFTGITANNVTAAITGEGTVCQSTPIVLSTEVTGGVAPYTYEWSNGLGAADTATPSTATVGTTTYTLTVRDANGSVSTDTADVVVTQGADAGTLTGGQTICNGVAAPITLSGYIGNIVRWERSTNTEFTNPAFIASTSPTLTSAEIGFLTGTRYIRAVVQNGSCEIKNSNWIQIEVLSTTWDGTAWSNGTPAAGKAAIFTGNYTAGASFNACTVQVTNNANVVIPEGFTATVTGRITVTSGTLTVASNAALVQTDAVANSGNIIVKRNSNPLFRLDYTMWGSPVAGQQLQAFSPATQSNRFYTYSFNWDATLSAGAAYVEQFWHADWATNFIPGRGYHIRMPNFVEGNSAYDAGNQAYVYPGTFIGVPNNGTISVPATVTDLNTGAPLSQAGHYILVSNPYPSPISVSDFFTLNSSVLEAGNGIYFWRKKNNSSVSSYAHLTMLGYTANGVNGGDMAGNGGAFYYNSQPGATTFNAGWIISPAQGFLVKLKTGLSQGAAVTFTNSMRRAAPASNGQPFFKTLNSGQTPSRLWLNLTGVNNAFSQAMVGYTEEGTLDLDYGYDAKILSDGSNKLYSKAADSQLAIQSRPSFIATDVVPVGFTAAAAGQYTIALDHFDGVFADDQDIYLADNLIGTTHNLKQGSYAFTTDAGTFETRFKVVYMPQGQLGVDNPELAKSVVIYQDGMDVKVASSSLTIDKVDVYDMLGRLIFSQSGVNNVNFSKTFTVAQQVVIVKVTLANGIEISKKVILTKE